MGVENLEIYRDFCGDYCKGMYVQLTLNSKGIWMVRPSLFYSVISFFMLEFVIQIAMLLVLEC
jgi:hypothetical protein